MNNHQYSVVFDGEKVPDSELFGVKQRLREVFKADRARIETLFTGKPVAIKRNLDRDSALKYQHMLKKIGIEVTLVEARATAATNQAKQAQTPTFSLAPLGSDLIESAGETAQNRPALLPTDHIDLAPQKGHLLKADERRQEPAAKLTGEYSEWNLSNKGEDLLKQSEKQIWQAADIDTSELEFANTQAPLESPTKQTGKPINTGHIELLPAEKT